MSTNSVGSFSSPRPTPQFYPQAQTFSTKKQRQSQNTTPREHLPPRPPVKSCPPVSRVFPHRKVTSTHAQVVSFTNTENNFLSPKYNENSNDLYFEQCFDDTEPIGQGSFGIVYRARSKEDGKYYAVKKSRDPFKGIYDRKRKMEEVAKHEALPAHPNCIQFKKAWEEKGHLYIQTELCKKSVSAYCEENHSISETLIWNYMVDLLMAVKHLHDRNLVHMDIKPENAFIHENGLCKLGDFGLVIDLTKNSDVSDAIEGDPKYLAPELMQGKFGKQADIFSLGMFILEMACDLDLPRGGDGWHLLRSGNLPQELLRERSYDLKYVIGQMLDPDYRNRPTVDQILSFPCVRNVFKLRMKKYMQTSVRSLRSFAAPTTAPARKPASPAKTVTPARGKDLSYSDDDSLNEEVGARGGSSDLLNSSDEFTVPLQPPPRRAFTTPAVRRRPATTSLNVSPIKRLLFNGSPTSSPISTKCQSPTTKLSDEDDERPGTPPPISSITAMDCDEPKMGIEPRNLLDMFEAASDDEDA